jgi:predicted permease
MHTLIQDLRYGLRMLARTPGFTAVAVAVLALGIGANTAIFTLIDGAMLRTLPIQHPEQLVLFDDDIGSGVVTGQSWGGYFSYFSHPFFEFLREHHQSFQSLCAVEHGKEGLWARVEGTAYSEPLQPVGGELVSGTYFKVLGVNAIVGRTLTIDDDTPSAHPAAVISYAYWKKQFHKDPNVPGKVLDVNGAPYTIVGVTPSEFFGERVGPPPDLWLPLVAQPRVMRRESWLNRQDVYWLNLMGRLKPGVSLRQAQAEMNVELRQFLTTLAGTKISESLRKEIQQAHVELKPGARGISWVRFVYSQPLHILMGIVALVLLIACANVANLLLARATARQREISVRLVLGAGRARLGRQLLTESILLAAMGGVAGMLFAAWGVKILVALAGVHDIVVKPDALVLSFAIGVSFITGILFGLAPVAQACKVDLVPTLKATSAGQTTGRSKLSLARGLVVFQVALSLLLLVGATLLARSLLKLATQDLGFQEDNLLIARIAPRAAGYQPGELPDLYWRMLDRLNALPGVRSASIAGYTPMSGTTQSGNISVEGHSPRQDEDRGNVFMDFVGPQYFETIGTPVLLGRGIGSLDSLATPKVAVVNETFVRDFFPNENPIGRRFCPGSPFRSPGFEIVAVVKDAKYDDLHDRPPRMAYFAVLQADDQSAYAGDILVRTGGNPDGATAEVRRAIREVGGRLPNTELTTLRKQVEGKLQEERLMTRLAGFFSLLALLLACVGLYGIMSYGMARRTSEIGLRMALGAQRSSILWMVLRESLTVLAMGITLGIPAALAASQLIKSFLFDISPSDPLALIEAVLVMAAVVMLAGYLPAWRASRIDPMVALRYE